MVGYGMTPLEFHRIKDSTAYIHNMTTPQWRDYLAYLLGRHVTLEETDTFLRNSGKRVLQEV